MNKTDIADQLAQLYQQCNSKEVTNTVRNLFELIADNLCCGNRVEIRGFGCFSRRKRAAGIVRNPKIGLLIETDGSFSVYFRAGNVLKSRVNSAC